MTEHVKHEGPNVILSAEFLAWGLRHASPDPAKVEKKAEKPKKPKGKK